MHNIWQKIQEAIDHHRPCVLATLIGVKGSTPQSGAARMLIYGDGSSVGTIGGGAFEHEVKKMAVSIFNSGRTRRFSFNLTKDLGMCCGGVMEVFMEPIQLKQELIIYGAGHVAAALAQLCTLIGFAVQMVDERTEWLDAESIPDDVQKHLMCPVKAVDHLPFHRDAYHFISTHSHSLDQDILLKIHDKPMKWLGMIGSVTKKKQFIKRCHLAGIKIEERQTLHTPAGIDISAKSPHEIAVSIAAQLIQYKYRV